MKHAIGGEWKENPRRNYFCTDTNDKDWNELCELGLATKRKSDLCRDSFFYVTEKGMDFLKKVLYY